MIVLALVIILGPKIRILKVGKEEKKEDLKKKKIDETKSAFDPNIDFEGKHSV